MYVTTKHALNLLLSTSLFFATFPQSPTCSNDADSPREVIRRLWTLAARGDLLDIEGWKKSSTSYSEPGLEPNYKTILIWSDRYYVDKAELLSDTSAQVDVEVIEVGRLDDAMKFVPAKEKPSVYKMSLRYKLFSRPDRIVIFGKDGKTKLSEKVIEATHVWSISGAQGPPWTTVNGAIRFVLEQRNKTTDLEIKRNADDTLVKLLTFH